MTRSFLLTGLLGAALLIPVELLSLGSLAVPVLLSVAALLLLLGAACGAIMAAIEAVIERARLGPARASCLRASGGILPLWLAGRSLFDGGFAATLPGAALGHLWVPALGTLGLSALLYALWPLSTIGRWRRVLSGLLLISVVAIELGNRRLYRSEYPDVHAFLVLVSVVMAGLSLRFAFIPPGPATAPAPLGHRTSLLFLALTSVLCTGCALGLQYGLHDGRVRWALATRGTHARHVARVVRSLLPAEALLEDAAPAEAPPPPPVLPPAPQEEVEALLSRTRLLHVLLISVDALRADMLAPTPENVRDFPNMLALVADSRYFRMAFSPAAGTDLSLACFLTGTINPFLHPAIDQTLPEAIKSSGRATHAVLPREVLRWAGETLLTRGLESFDRVITDPLHKDVGSHTTSAETTSRGLEFLDRRPADRPFFLWLHYFDVHEHDQIEARDADLREVLGGRPRSRAQKYRGLLRIVDREIGRALDGVRERGLFEQTVILFLSDHGESLGEDARFPENHGHFVYNALVHVPVALRIPGISPGEIAAPISLIDVMPTLLQLTGASASHGVDGATLVPYLIGEVQKTPAETRRPIVINESEQYALVLWPHKLLVRPADRLVELYDLTRDFAERNDLSESRPDKVRELHRLYRRFPKVVMDRTLRGRRLREQLAQPQPPPG